MPTYPRRRVRRLRAIVATVLASTVTLLFPTGAQACEGASHYRVFPIGLAGGDLIAARMIVGRGGGHEGDPVTWGGTLELVRMSLHGELRKVLSTQQVSGPDDTRGYEAAMRPALLRAHRQARKTITGLRPLSAPTAAFCDVSTYCRAAAWTTSLRAQIALDIHVGKHTAIRRPLVVAKQAQEDLLQNPNLPFSYDKDQPFIDILEEHRIVLDFSSVRAYTSGETTVFVVHLTAGVKTMEAPNPDDPLAHDFDMVNGRRDQLPKRHCKRNQTCVFYEPTPYHATGFDVVITVPSPVPNVKPPKPLPRREQAKETKTSQPGSGFR